MGSVDWQALPYVGELLGVRDYEQWIADLLIIQNWNREQNA